MFCIKVAGVSTVHVGGRARVEEDAIFLYVFVLGSLVAAVLVGGRVHRVMAELMWRAQGFLGFKY